MPRRQFDTTSIETTHQPSNTASPVLASGITKLRERQASAARLQSSVPQCARRCLSRHASNGFDCTANNLSCLCSQYSSEGFTLGELAYTCLQLECGSEAVHQSKLELYNICAVQSNAVRATHSTLTLPATATIFTSSKPAPRTAIDRTTSTSHIQPTTTRQTSVTPILSTSASASLASTTVSLSSASQTATTTPGGKVAASSHGLTTLTTAQAVGVSVASIGALVLAIGVIVLYAFIRRRRMGKQRNGRHSYDFVDASPARFSPSNHGFKDLGGTLGGFPETRAELGEGRRRARWPGPEMMQKETSGHGWTGDKSPRIEGSLESCRSDGSMRTLSQLLPEKPTTIARKPVPKPPRPASNFTTATIFEEDRSPRVTSPVLARFPAPPTQAHTAPERPRLRPAHAANWTRSLDTVAQPSLSLQIPPLYSSRNKIATSEAFPPSPAIPTNPPHEPSRPTSNSSRTRSASSSTSYLPTYYTFPAPPTPHTPISPSTQTRRPAPGNLKLPPPPALAFAPRAYRTSGASDTSFESTDPDEPTPPTEDEQQQAGRQLLTPVEESSPVSRVRYPKVPRSSNQAVPRSPAPTLSPRTLRAGGGLVTPERPRQGAAGTTGLSGSTLATNGGGTGATGTVREKQSPRHKGDGASPLKGYGANRCSPSCQISGQLPANSPAGNVVPPFRRKASVSASLPREQVVEVPVETAGKEALGSPLWEPKLTPDRRRADLWLSVGVASPGVGVGFSR